MSADANPITVLQLSDLHLFATADQQLLGITTDQSLNLVLEAVKALPNEPDVILLTGDLAQDESAETYHVIQDKFAGFSTPIYAIPGNHDNPNLLKSILAHSPFQTKRTFVTGGWQFILLDSSVKGEVHGELSKESLTNLRETLSTTQNPTVLALHHPPYPVQSEWLDHIGLQNREEFWRILDDYPQVKTVLCGHIHQESPFSRQGVEYLSTPSTCVQFKPRSQNFAADPADPGFRLLKLWPDGNYQSWIQRVSIHQSVNPRVMGY